MKFIADLSKTEIFIWQIIDSVKSIYCRIPRAQCSNETAIRITKSLNNPGAV